MSRRHESFWRAARYSVAMDLISLIIVLAVVGFVLWLVITYIPMPQPVKTVIIAIAVLILVIWLLRSIGLPSIRI